MNIALVFPPFAAEDIAGKSSIRRVLNIISPLGLAYIAAVLEKKGYTVRIFDCSLGLSYGALIKALVEFQPQIVGISASTPAFESAKKVATNIREGFPKAVVVIGGPHVTALPVEVLSFPCFDVGVIGEGEATFLELVKTIEATGLSNLDSVNGIAYCHGGKVVVTQMRSSIKNLDDLPFPARHLLPPLSAYKPTPASYRRLPQAVVMSSRGCPHRCIFCDRSIFGNRFRARSAGNVVDELEELVKYHGAREIRFFDDTFTLDKNRVYQICELLLSRNLKLSWMCCTRVNAVTNDLLKAMKKAGCWQISYGLESGDPRMLKLLNKGTTVEENEQAVRWAKEVGLSVSADFLLGTPGETKESMERTLAFAKKLKIDFPQFNKFIPFPGTRLYALLAEQGYEFDFSHSSVLDYSEATYIPDSLSEEEYKKFFNRAYREFYLRPGYIARRLFSIKSMDELKGHLQGGFAILGLRSNVTKT